jgi:hypothetical protein
MLALSLQWNCSRCNSRICSAPCSMQRNPRVSFEWHLSMRCQHSSHSVAAQVSTSSLEVGVNATLVLVLTGYFLLSDTLQPALHLITTPLAHLLRLGDHSIEPALHTRPEHKIRIQPRSKVSIPSRRASGPTFQCRHRRAGRPHSLSSSSVLAHKITQARAILLEASIIRNDRSDIGCDVQGDEREATIEG